MDDIIGRLLEANQREAAAIQSDAKATDHNADATKELTRSSRKRALGDSESHAEQTVTDLRDHFNDLHDRGKQSDQSSFFQTAGPNRSSQVDNIYSSIQVAEQQLDQGRLTRARQTESELAPARTRNIESRNAREEAWRPVKSLKDEIGQELGTILNRFVAAAGEIVSVAVPTNKKADPHPPGWDFIHQSKGFRHQDALKPMDK